MYNFLLKNGTAVAMGVGSLIAVLFFITINVGLSSSGYDTSTDLLTVNYQEINAFNFGIYMTYLLGFIAFLLMLVGIVWDLWNNRKASKNMIYGVIALIVLFFVLYVTAKFETGGSWDVLNSEFGITEGSSKIVTAGIYTCGLLLLGAVLSIAVSEVRNFFK
jgi:uncharacterized membrane protein YozB (DUF420 family)